MTHFMDCIALGALGLEHLGEPGEKLDFLPEEFPRSGTGSTVGHDLSAGLDECGLGGGQHAAGLFDGPQIGARPEEYGDQHVDHDAHACLRGAEHGVHEQALRRTWAGNKDDQAHKTGHVPEIAALLVHKHHVGGEEDPRTSEQQAQPAALRGQREDNERTEAAGNRPHESKHAFVERLTCRGHGDHGHGKSRPVGVHPVHLQGDAVDQHQGQSGLYRLLELRHPVHK